MRTEAIGVFMSDTYTFRRYQRATIHPLGLNRKKKYLKIFLLALLISMTGIVYLAYTSGIFADANPEIPRQMITRINLERQASDFQPFELSASLTSAALKKSQDVRISPMVYQSGSSNTDGTSVFIVPKISWAISRLDSRQSIVDSFENADAGFRTNVLNQQYHAIGIGVTSDSYNYYIVTMFQ
jgi:hypothetical protein